MPSKCTIHRSWCGDERTTVSAPRSVCSTEPGSSALGALGGEQHEHLAPHAVRLRDPTHLEEARRLGGSVFELDVDVDAVTDGGGADDGADGVGDAAALADHAAHVVGTDAHLEADATALLDRVDADGVGIVDQRRDEQVEDRDGGGGRIAVGIVGRSSAAGASSIRLTSSSP